MYYAGALCITVLANKDRQTDCRQFHRPYSAYYATVNKNNRRFQYITLFTPVIQEAQLSPRDRAMRRVN